MQVKDLEVKLARVKTLFPLIEENRGALEKVEGWWGELQKQIEDVRSELNKDGARTELNQKNIDDAIDSINNGIRELENYLLSKAHRNIVARLKHEPDPRAPFLEDAHRVIVDLFSRVGKLGVRLEEVPDERERQKLKEQLTEVDNLLENISVTADAADISWARATLNGIEHRLPPSNQFWTMLSPILGVVTLQVGIWLLAYAVATHAQVYVVLD